MPLVSVVIPLYNKEPHIRRAIDSILAQKVQDFEILVIDDGSTDKSAEIVKNYTDSRIQLIQQENSGVSAARNRGIKEATAEIIAFLDADDEWLPTFLETILLLKKKYPEAGAYATAYFIEKNGVKYEAHIKAIPPKPWGGIITRFFYTAIFCEPITSSTVCIQKTVFNNIGLFIEGEWYGEDTEMWGRIALQYDIVFSWNFGAIIYQTNAINRATKSKKFVKEHPATRMCLNYINNNKKEINPALLKDLSKYIERLKLKTSARALNSGNPKYAREILAKCNSKDFIRNKIYIYLLSYLSPNMFHFLIQIKQKFCMYVCKIPLIPR
jgi:glycosyltransferase involved in cell wall biosynthesis